MNGVYHDAEFWQSVGVDQGFGEDRDPAITFDLRQVCTLEKFVIWSGHELAASVRRMTVEVYLDGANFMALGDRTLTAISPNAETNLLGSVVARYLCFDILENGSGVTYPVVGSPTGWSLVAIDEVEFHGIIAGPGAGHACSGL